MKVPLNTFLTLIFSLFFHILVLGFRMVRSVFRKKISLAAKCRRCEGVPWFAIYRFHLLPISFTTLAPKNQLKKTKQNKKLHSVEEKRQFIRLSKSTLPSLYKKVSKGEPCTAFHSLSQPFLKLLLEKNVQQYKCVVYDIRTVDL